MSSRPVRSSELHRGLWAWFGAVGHHQLASSRGPSPSTFRSAVRRRAARLHLAGFAVQLQAASSLPRKVRPSVSIVFAPQRKHPEIRQLRVFKSSAVEKGKKERGAAGDSSDLPVPWADLTSTARTVWKNPTSSRIWRAASLAAARAALRPGSDDEPSSWPSPSFPSRRPCAGGRESTQLLSAMATSRSWGVPARPRM